MFWTQCRFKYILVWDPPSAGLNFSAFVCYRWPHLGARSILTRLKRGTMYSRHVWGEAKRKEEFGGLARKAYICIAASSARCRKGTQFSESRVCSSGAGPPPSINCHNLWSGTSLGRRVDFVEILLYKSSEQSMEFAWTCTSICGPLYILYNGKGFWVFFIYL
jgi:hypothetical protein